MTLIHEGGHRSRKELKNYPPISVIDTVLANVFSGLLSNRLSECCERNGLMREK